MSAPAHDIYVLPTAAKVAALVENEGWASAMERWGDRLCRHSLERLERAGRRPGRVVGMRIRRAPGERLSASVDRRWDALAPLTPSAAAALVGVDRRVMETMH